ncbi:MAG: nicotinate (nicotinamide) nucleotide adenylyltransferase [Campylobacteraceae bacterium]|nr:nicotinate (nicotinamide) nucleotide adenylyltransferase [Campylobacteraceae bacterium]
MKIAVFGGSFDPPHVGHEQIVYEALKALHVDKIFVIPTYLNPFKDSFGVPANLRLEWLRNLFKGNGKVKVLDYEVRQKRAVATIETIKYLLKNYGIEKIYLIIGADNYEKLPLWYSYDELKSLVEFVIATRDDIILPKELKKIKINANISSSKLRKHLNASFIPKSIKKEVLAYYTRKIMEKRIENIVKILDEKKAENIQSFDMSDRDYFVDSVVIATTLGDRHGLALLNHLKTELKNEGETFLNIEESEDWAIIDMGDILVHLMSPEYRARYNIEEFLSDYKSPEKEN